MGLEQLHEINKMHRQIEKVHRLGGRDSFFGMMEIFEIILEEEHAKENETGMYRFKGMEQYGNIVTGKRVDDAIKRCIEELNFTEEEIIKLIDWYKGRGSIDCSTLALMMAWYLKDNNPFNK